MLGTRENLVLQCLYKQHKFSPERAENQKESLTLQPQEPRAKIPSIRITGTVLLLSFGYALTFLIVFYGLLESYDLSGFQALNQLASSSAIAYLAIAVNEFGSELVLLPFAGLIYLVSRNRKLETTSLIIYAIIVSEVVLTILKTAYFRPRPSQTLVNAILPLGPETDSSFPSGHTTRAFAVATLTTAMRGRKYSFLLVLAGGVAVSRVVLGVHFPLDVIGGSFLGLLVGIVSYETGRRLYSYVMPRLFPDRTFQ